MVLRLPAAITLPIAARSDLGLCWDGQCCPAVLSVGEGPNSLPEIGPSTVM